MTMGQVVDPLIREAQGRSTTFVGEGDRSEHPLTEPTRGPLEPGLIEPANSSGQKDTCGTCRSFSTSSSKSWAGANPIALATRFVGKLSRVVL